MTILRGFVALFLVTTVPCCLASLTTDKVGVNTGDDSPTEPPKCGPSLQVVFTEKISASYANCSAMKIDDFNCLAACFLQEMGMVKEGEWQESASMTAWDGMLDNSKPDYKQKLTNFWEDANKCINKKLGKKFPTDFKSNDCQDVAPLVSCILGVVSCPKI